MLADVPLYLNLAGALAFGLLIGWVTGSILRRAKRDGLSDISTVIGAIGGAAIIGLFPKENGAFGLYAIGLALGFAWYIRSATRPGAVDWLGEAPGSQPQTRRIPASRLPDTARE
jgi:NhaP-type Na+/H+ or K+/H+ antiporter